jgi:predicted nucleic acid-binding protein
MDDKHPVMGVAERPFFDSNTLLYSVSTDLRKAEIAEGLMAKGGSISVQVLNEVANVARRKLGMSWEEVSRTLTSIRNLCAQPRSLTVETHESAVRIAERYGYSMYDALILASALEAGCNLLYSEDMQDGQNIEGLTIRNPFAGKRS